MVRQIAFSRISLALLLWVSAALPANAQVVYDIEGSFNTTDNACTQIVYGIGGGDCSYAQGRGSSVTWFGPSDGASYYAIGSAGDTPRQPPFGTPRYAAPITGTLTIDDGGTVSGTDDTIQGQIVVGAVARNLVTGQSTRGVESWDTMTFNLPETTVSFATANGQGGFTYVIGSQGFPIPICSLQTPVNCFPTPSYSGISPPVNDITGDYEFVWSGPDPAGVGIEASTLLAPPSGNIGIALSGDNVSFTNYQCETIVALIGTPAPAECNNNVAISQVLLASPVYSNLATPANRWGNLVMQVSTNSSGQITSAEVYWTHEYYIRFPSSSPTTGPANSFAAGKFTFTGETPVPKCNDDTAEVLEDSSNNIIDVLEESCSFPLGATITLVASPTKGTASVNGSNQIVYSPNAGSQGSDSLVYQADGDGFTDQATLIINIAPDTVPIAPDGQIVISTQGVAPASAVGSLNLTTLPGFNLGQSGVTTISTQGAKGTATVSGTTVTYTPNADFFAGEDSFQYTVTDQQNDTSTGTITVTIADVSPTISGGSISTDQDQASLPVPLTFTLGNGSSAQHTLSIGTQATAGTCTLSASTAASAATVIYTPNSGFFGPDSCVVRITDGNNSVADGTFAINVKAVFSAQPDYAEAINGQPAVIPVLENDHGVSFPVTLIIFTNPQHGSVSISGDGRFANPEIIYTPFNNMTGTDTFEYAFQVGKKVAIGAVTVSLIQTINDADADGVNDDVDNCLGAANPDQRDGDGDGYGTWCDADFNNDGRVNFADLSAFRVLFGATDPIGDFNGDGSVNLLDLGRFKTLFGGTPGPSALTQ